MASSIIADSEKIRNRLSLEDLRGIIDYNPLTGVIFRKNSKSSVGIGYIKLGTRSNGGEYRIVNIKGKKYRAHHLAWIFMTGSWPEYDVDHIDGDRDNNIWQNLRAATRSQNCANARLSKRNTSGIKGVSFDKERGKWKAQIGIGFSGGKSYSQIKVLGRFETKEQAAQAYKDAAVKRFGEFARTE